MRFWVNMSRFRSRWTYKICCKEYFEGGHTPHSTSRSSRVECRVSMVVIITSAFSVASSMLHSGG